VPLVVRSPRSCDRWGQRGHRGRFYKFNSSKHVPQKYSLASFVYKLNPVSILSVPIRTVHKALNRLNQLMAGFVQACKVEVRLLLI
jgi:hypothetical protein